MATSRNPLAGRYFNDPNMASAMSNLAAAFAPPDGREQLAWTQANAAQAQEQRLAELYSLAGGDFDMGNIAAGNYNPTSSFKALEMGDATARRGQDIGSADSRYGVDSRDSTSLATNAADNERHMRLGALGAATDPKGRQEISDDEMMAIMGMEGLPGQSMAQPVAPPSETQVRGGMLEEAMGAGLITPEDTAAAELSGIPIEQIIMEGGGVQNVRRSDAVGEEPYINRGAEAKPTLETYKTPDGRTGTGIFDPQVGRWVDTQSGEPLPEGTVTGKITDTSEGGLTTANQTRVDQTIMGNASAVRIIDDTVEMLANDPNIAGVVGGARRLVQNAQATLSNINPQAGQELRSALESDPTMRSLLDPEFNTDLSSFDAQMNMLIWTYLNGQQGGGKVSNDQIKQARASFGIDSILANADQLTANLSRLRSNISAETEDAMPFATQSVQERFGGRFGAGQPEQGGGAQPAPPEAGTIIDGHEFLGGDPADQNSWRPVE